MGITRHLLVLLALAFLIGAFFANSFKSGMTLDNRYIIEEYYRTLTHQDPTLDLKSGKQIATIFENDYWSPKGISGLYRPLTVLSYWLDYVIINGKAPKHDDELKPILGPDQKPIPPATYQAMSWKDYADAPGHLPVGSYHAINLAVHWLNASLLYFLCLTMLKRFWPSALAAGLFATHPIVVESVTNIIGRADLFAGVTILGGLLLYARSTVSLSLWRRVPWLLGLMLLVGLGLFSKESAIAVGVIVPLYWLVFRCDWNLRSAADWPTLLSQAEEIWIVDLIKATWRDRFRRQFVMELLAWSVMLLPLAGMMTARHYVFSHSTPAEEPFLDNPIRGISSVESLHLPSFEAQLRDRPVLGVSWLECRMTAIKVLGKLIGLLVLPITLCSDYSYPQIPNFSWKLFRWEDWQAIVALLMFIAIGLFTWQLWKRGQKSLVFWICFFFLAALPTANLVYPIGSIMAERFMYVPLAGFAVVLSIAIYAAAEWLGKRVDNSAGVAPVATGVLLVVCVLYGLRTHSRNKVWENDETLWRDAIQWSPRSFRCYQSLAFALYERKDAVNYLDEMIKLDSTARPLVDDLPDHLNSARLYLHLGMYMSIKGDSLLQRNSDNTANMTPAAQDCYERAIEALKKGSAVDRAFDEMIKARQVRRGDPPEKISDMGLSPLYGILALCQSRLGQVTESLNSIQYQRQLDVTDVDSYRKEAAICMDHGRLDQAAVALIQAIIISGDASYWNMLGQLYARSDTGKNAIIVQEGHPKFNLANPLLRQHMITAYTRFVRDTRRAHRPELAKATHDAAITNFGLPAEFFNNLLREPIAICTPQGIQPDEIDPTCKPVE